MRILILLILALPLFAEAREREAIPVVRANENIRRKLPLNALRRIDLITADECFASLRPVALPFDVVREGIDALVDQSFSPMANLACVEDALKNWDRYKTPEREVPTSKPLKKVGDKGPDRKREDELNEKLYCYNDKPANSTAFEKAQELKKARCEGKWLSASEGESLKRELEREIEKNQVLSDQADNEDLPEVLRRVYGTNVANTLRLPNGKTKADILRCNSGDAPGSEAYNKKLAAVGDACGGKLVSKNDAKEEMKAFNKLSNPVVARAAPLKLYLEELRKANPEATVFKMAARLSCFSSYDAGSYSAKLHRELNEAKCGSFGIRTGGEARYNKEIFPELQKLLPEFDKWLKKKDAEEKAEAEAYDRQNPERYENYGVRRLFARFENFLRKGGDPKTLRAFCETFEADQRRDLKYAQHGLSLTPFEEKREWDNAADLGLTEGESSAVKLYTGAFFNEINPALWKTAQGVPLSKRHEVYLEQMKAAFERLPAYRGAVRRFSYLPSEVLAQHEPGKVVEYAAYTSTSSDPKWEWEGGEDGDSHGFLIYGASGRAVEKVTATKGEQEVLFPPGSRFKVLSKKPRAGKEGVFDFVMAEVDASGNVIAEVPADAGRVP